MFTFISLLLPPPLKLYITYNNAIHSFVISKDSGFFVPLPVSASPTSNFPFEKMLLVTFTCFLSVQLIVHSKLIGSFRKTAQISKVGQFTFLSIYAVPTLYGLVDVCRVSLYIGLSTGTLLAQQLRNIRQYDASLNNNSRV